jgi:hypothetical protein
LTIRNGYAPLEPDYRGLSQVRPDPAQQYARISASVSTGHTMHRLTNYAVAVDGDAARASTYVDVLIFAPDNNSGVNAVGFHDDELIRTAAEGWRIARRRFTAVRIVAIGEN